MPIKFEITTKDGGTLHTATKYCEEDINIVPKLQNKTVTENGTVLADEGYAGLGTVTVDVQTAQHNSLQSAVRIITNSFTVITGLPNVSLTLSE